MINIFDWEVSKRVSIIVAAVCVGSFVAAEVAAGTSTHPPQAYAATAVREILRGDGINQVTFGEAASEGIARLQGVIAVKPTNRYYSLHTCDVDHGSKWPGFIAFFRRGRFVGYTYSGAKLSRGEQRLATEKDLRVGDSLSRGTRLYGHAFSMSSVQGGAWSVNTSQGRLFGFASGLPIGAHSTVLTIEAGNVGCPAMTP